MGRWDGKIESLPTIEPAENAVEIQEKEGVETFSLVIGIFGMILSYSLLLLRWGLEYFDLLHFVLGILLQMIIFLPHELLHALVLKDEAYLFRTKKGIHTFIVGPEHMSKKRWIMMNLMPTLVLVVIPYVITMFIKTPLFGVFTAVSIGSNTVDYSNIIYALTQMPKGSMMYLRHFKTYWYTR